MQPVTTGARIACCQRQILAGWRGSRAYTSSCHGLPSPRPAPRALRLDGQGGNSKTSWPPSIVSSAMLRPVLSVAVSDALASCMAAGIRGLHPGRSRCSSVHWRHPANHCGEANRPSGQGHQGHEGEQRAIMAVSAIRATVSDAKPWGQHVKHRQPWQMWSLWCGGPPQQPASPQRPTRSDRW